MRSFACISTFQLSAHRFNDRSVNILYDCVCVCGVTYLSEVVSDPVAMAAVVAVVAVAPPTISWTLVGGAVRTRNRPYVVFS